MFEKNWTVGGENYEKRDSPRSLALTAETKISSIEGSIRSKQLMSTASLIREMASRRVMPCARRRVAVKLPYLSFSPALNSMPVRSATSRRSLGSPA